MRTLLSALMLSSLAIGGATPTLAQSAGYDDIQIQVGLEKFVLTPSPALTVHGIGSASPNGGSPDPALGDTFSFGERELTTLEPILPEEANEAWPAISRGGVPHAAAFTYFMNCSSNSDLPLSLAALCQVPLLERGLLLNIKGNELGREIGTHLERSRPGRPNTMPVGQDGSMTVRKDGRSYWEGQLLDGPVAVLCDKRFASGWYECSHVRGLTQTTFYQVVFTLAAENPPPSDAEWLSFSSAVATIFRSFYDAASMPRSSETVR
jgi:hypothetical protein